jgi:hypothetical protein
MTELRPPRPSLPGRLFQRAAVAIDRKVGWDRLPLPLGLAVLIGYRDTLRRRNLYDTGGIRRGARPTPTPDQAPAPPPSAGRRLIARTADGTYNDLDYPTMGSAGARFGRNFPPNYTYPEPDSSILRPNPRTVSRALLTRDRFIPATSLNLLAGAWLQFMIHDWFSHGKNETENPWQVSIAADDDWPKRPMEILRTRRDPTASPGAGGPPTFANTETHWWDGSQLYGSDAATQARVRSGHDGKLTIGPDGLLPLHPTSGIDITGVFGNWWIGLSLLHTLFTLEHNAICDRLRAEYRGWTDDELFDHARLINAALMVKIHTTDWTPTITAHPTTRVALRGNWWGLQQEKLSRSFGRLTHNDFFSGIPTSEPDHHGVPYSLTEEFVAVYRMHPLLPDEFSFRSAADDTVLLERTFPEVAFRNARTVFDHVSVADALYTFGTSHPGAITLHNYPRFLQRFEEPDTDGNVLNDLGAIDILRIRERGVPRYNEFRRLMQRPPIKRFEDLTDNREWAEQIRRVYDDNIEDVDLMVGLYAEPLPRGYGFSDTAFRVFILMATRRIKSDRFLTVDYTPRVYTQTGIDWVERNDLATVLLRHFPRLSPFLRTVPSAFAPWPKASA